MPGRRWGTRVEGFVPFQGLIRGLSLETIMIMGLHFVDGQFVYQDEGQIVQLLGLQVAARL